MTGVTDLHLKVEKKREALRAALAMAPRDYRLRIISTVVAIASGDAADAVKEVARYFNAGLDHTVVIESLRYHDAVLTMLRQVEEACRAGELQ